VTADTVEVPRVWDFVRLYGPGGHPLPGIVTHVVPTEPPRCTVRGFAANGLVAIDRVPVREVPGEDWHCALVARFEVEG